MPSVAINTAQNGQSALVAAPSSATQFIRVHGYVMVAGGTVNVKFQAGNTDLTGAMPLIADSGVVAPYADDGWFDLPGGQALNINLSAGQQVSGHLAYSEHGF